VLHNPVEISMQTYETLLEQQNLGDIHPTLVRGAKWYLPDERKQLAADAQAELEKLGLQRGGRINGEFLDTLQLLQRPAVEYYTWVKSTGQQRTIRTARSEREAVIVVAVNDKLYLAPTRPETIAFDLAIRLPETKPAHTHSLNCAESDLQLLMGGGTLTGASPSIRDAKKVLGWLKMPYTHYGQLYAAIRDGNSNRKRTPKPPGWMDTEQGRVVFGVDASSWISLAGAGPQDIAGRLTQLEGQLRGR
jgi:hypothetical protein